MSKAKIAIFGWPDSIHVQRWAQGLSSRGYCVKVIGIGRQPVPGIDSTVYRTQGKLSYLLHLGPARREIDRFAPDLIHVHYASSFGLWIVGRTERPNVVSVWGSDIVKFPSNYLKRKLLGRVFHYASAVTATSKYLLDQTVGKYPEVADRIKTIPFGVVPRQEEFPFPEGNELRICALKSHRRIYGQDVLLKAAGLLHKKGVRLRLSLPGGPGPETRYYQELVKRLDLSEVVTFGGWLAPDTIYRFIGNHHVMVLPSRSEGFGVAALEASACGRPVIATRVGGLPEVVEDGRTGILVDPGDVEGLGEAIARLANDRELLSSMGAAGRHMVESRYLWEHSLDAMESLYEKLLRT